MRPECSSKVSNIVADIDDAASALMARTDALKDELDELLSSKRDKLDELFSSSSASSVLNDPLLADRQFDDLSRGSRRGLEGVTEGSGGVKEGVREGHRGTPSTTCAVRTSRQQSREPDGKPTGSSIDWEAGKVDSLRRAREKLNRDNTAAGRYSASTSVEPPESSPFSTRGRSRSIDDFNRHDSSSTSGNRACERMAALVVSDGPSSALPRDTTRADSPPLLENNFFRRFKMAANRIFNENTNPPSP
jgi:hypothetical protein